MENHLTRRTRGRCSGTIRGRCSEEPSHQKNQGKVYSRTISPRDPREDVTENHQRKVQWRSISPKEPGEGELENQLAPKEQGDDIKVQLRTISQKELLVEGVVENHQGKVSEKPSHQKNQGEGAVATFHLKITLWKVQGRTSAPKRTRGRYSGELSNRENQGWVQ